jgi:CTP synthase
VQSHRQCRSKLPALLLLLQVDLDLGNYERFLDITLTRDNNLTTGKVYQVGCDQQLSGS